MDWNLTVATISMIIGAAAAWFGYLAVRDKLPHRRRRPTTAPTPVPPDDAYDAFISYAPDDEDTAEKLAHALQERGLNIFLAKWIDIGLVENTEKENALQRTTNGILLFSHTTMTRPDIRDDYAALLQRTHTTGHRFIPVLIDNTHLPPFAKIRKPLNLTNNQDNKTQLDALARAIRKQ